MRIDFYTIPVKRESLICVATLIAKEAGAIITDMHGEGDWLESGDIVAANPKILAQMLQIIGAHL